MKSKSVNAKINERPFEAELLNVQTLKVKIFNDAPENAVQPLRPLKFSSLMINPLVLRRIKLSTSESGLDPSIHWQGRSGPIASTKVSTV